MLNFPEISKFSDDFQLDFLNSDIMLFEFWSFKDSNYSIGRQPSLSTLEVPGSMLIATSRARAEDRRRLLGHDTELFLKLVLGRIGTDFRNQIIDMVHKVCDIHRRR